MFRGFIGIQDDKRMAGLVSRAVEIEGGGKLK